MGVSDATISSGGRSMSEAPPTSIASLKRHVATAGIAGVITGLVVGGVGGRLFMRVSAATAPDHAQGAATEAGNRVGEITFGGTLSVVLFIGFLTGVMGAVLYVLVRPWLHWAGPLRGSAFGVLLFAISSATSDVLNPDNPDFLILQNELLNVSMIAALFFGYGVMIDRMFGVVERRLPKSEGRDRLPRFLSDRLSLRDVVSAAVLVAMVVVLQFTGVGCDCGSPMVASAFLVVSAAGTVLWWAVGIRSRTGRASSIARIMGFGGLTGALLFGLIRAVSDAVEVIT